LLERNTTGDDLIRAGVPDDWKVGDKTGGGDYGTRNDIAVLWPAGDAEPIVVAILTRRDGKDAEWQDAHVADAHRAVAGTRRRGGRGGRRHPRLRRARPRSRPRDRPRGGGGRGPAAAPRWARRRRRRGIGAARPAGGISP